MIELRELSFAYGEQVVLDRISFIAQGGSLLSILGPNGAGKSTLFRCILGLERGYSGEILCDGESTRRLSARELARRMAYIPQSHAPAFSYSVLEMVLMGTTAGSGLLGPGETAQAAALQALERLGISGLRERGYAKLSGGERQLVLIARAIAQRAKTLILDEPTASLDYGNQLMVMDQIRALADDGYTVLQSTHDPERAYLYSDRILALDRGRVLCEGTSAETVTGPVLSRLYGAELSVLSLCGDRARACLPRRCEEKKS